MSIDGRMDSSNSNSNSRQTPSRPTADCGLKGKRYIAAYTYIKHNFLSYDDQKSIIPKLLAQQMYHPHALSLHT